MFAMLIISVSANLNGNWLNDRSFTEPKRFIGGRDFESICSLLEATRNWTNFQSRNRTIHAMSNRVAEFWLEQVEREINAQILREIEIAMFCLCLVCDKGMPLVCSY